MDPTLIDSSEPLLDYQRSWDFQHMVNEQTSHRQYQILVAVTKERDDLRQANATYEDELGLLRRKNVESEGRVEVLSQKSQDLGNQLQENQTLEVESSQRIEWLENCLATQEMDYRKLEDRAQATKTKYDMRLRKVGGFVLIGQENVQRMVDELQESEEAFNVEIAEADASEYSLVQAVKAFALS